MKLHRIAILFFLRFGHFFQFARGETSAVFVEFNGQRFACFPVVNAPYIAEETTSQLRTGNWWEVKARVLVDRDSKRRQLRRQRVEDMFVKGATPPNHTMGTNKHPPATR